MKKRILALVLAVALAMTLGLGAAAAYTVQPGDNLSSIAKNLLGDASKWKDIFNANKDKLSDPNKIYVGQELTIPGTEPAAPVLEAAVTELTVAGNQVFVYAPKSEMVLSSTCTAPCFMVFGNEACTAESVKADAQASGLGALAAAEGATIVYINPQGEGWAEADLGVYAGLIDLYSNSSTSSYVDGIANEYNFFTGSTAQKILGDTGRVYIYGVGAGADFVAANLMKKVVAKVTYPDGFSMTFDRTPTTVTLIDAKTIPAAAEPADIAVAVVGGPADAAEKLAGLTDNVLISDEDIATVYKKLSGAWRRQAGVLLPVHDWAAEGITEKVESYTLASGKVVNVATYYADDLKVTDASNPVPLVLAFHGGGNTALYEAQATEWPLIGKENGFITVSVDLHYPNTTAAETVELIELLKDVYAIDASRIYASGFSMGSIKSWDLFEQYPTLFAGLAPMDGSEVVGTDSYGTKLDSYNTDTLVPVFYVGGQTSPLPELANQDQKIKDRLAYAFETNNVADKYVYDEAENLWWGMNGDIVYQVTDKVAFKDSTLNVHLFQSEDGRYYTALADATNMSHEVYARNSWAAWDFLKQFSRAADGSIVIKNVAYELPSDDYAVTGNSYNQGDTGLDTRVATSAVFTQTTGGAVMGYSVDGIDQYYGIPYATADRFMAPEAASWNGIKVCWAYGEVCPQWGEVAEQDPFNFMHNQKLMIENEAKCLNLNVLTKGVSEDGELKPVFVWFHGGGWTTGSSYQQDLYDGINLVELGDVVFVSINHRLNALGFLDLSAYGEEYKDSANVGVMDMVLALEWVRDNAEAFGGDPNNVTIAGQSGGGSKVTTLMGLPSAQGLFHKAVAMSGGSAAVTRTHEQAQAETEKVLAELGITAENIDDIKTIDYDDLYAAYNAAGYRAGPVLDDEFYPTGTMELSAQAGIPLLTTSVLGEFSTNIGGMIYGTPNFPVAMAEFIFNAEFVPSSWDEDATMKMLEKSFGDKAADVKAAFEAAYPGHPVGEVLFMNKRADSLATGYNAVGGTAYQSIQAWSYPMFGGVVPIHTAGDVPLWFYNLDLIRHFIAGYEDVAEDVSMNMVNTLISLCYEGTPGWEAWDAETDAIMVFDEVSEVRYHHEDTLLELLRSK